MPHYVAEFAEDAGTAADLVEDFERSEVDSSAAAEGCLKLESLSLANSD
jgi:hypothetical protein